MLFNSLEFAIFLPLVFIAYWFIFHKNLTIQNLFILFSSYLFYGWWDWRFLSLIFVSSLTDYLIGIQLAKTVAPPKRKRLLLISLGVNLGLLACFKYFNFFIESLVDLFTTAGITLNVKSLQIILPVGISFYTFQTLSYTIDIYRNKLKPTHDFIAFFAFVSFFPQLVAGPIERAKNLLPQFQRPRSFHYEQAADGLRQMLWGLFKKIVVADTCAVAVEYIFNKPATLSGGILLVGVTLFAFQIYGDFSGYSDIAIGAARLLGFDLMRNFAFPYFSRDIAEFWRRWHISLSTWFRDYLFIPLGGSRGTRQQRIRNILITFTVSGFWHGANWTFLIWGFLNGLYYVPLMLLNRQKKHTAIVAQNRIFPTPGELVQMLLTFLITLVAWIFFRASSLQEAWIYLNGLFSKSICLIPLAEIKSIQYPLLKGCFFCLILVIVEWFQRRQQHGLQINHLNGVVRWVIYLIIFTITLYSANYHDPQEFIYFQF